jgi:hypothetical protein
MYRAVCICPRMRKWDSRGYSRLPRADSSRGRSTFGSRVVFRGSRTFCRLSSTESNGRVSRSYAPLTASPLPTGPGSSHEDRRSLITLSCITQKIGSHYSFVRHEALVALRGPSQHASVGLILNQNGRGIFGFGTQVQRSVRAHDCGSSCSLHRLDHSLRPSLNWCTQNAELFVQ